MWPKLGLTDLPWGPRPGDPSNITPIDYIEMFSVEQQTQIMRAYTDLKFTHAPMGPLVDAGYHGQIPSCDWRTNPGPYFDAAEKWAHEYGVYCPHFLRPDKGCAGLDWTVADLERELSPIFRTRRAQSIMQIVVLGWEPGDRYEYDNAWWVEMCQWMAKTFPQALRLIHMVADCDAPTGGNDDKKGLTNGVCWANVAPYIHGFLAQYGGYVGNGYSGQSVEQFIPNITGAIADLNHRFITGYPGDWPTFSAFGPHEPIRVYAGEFWAFRGYWGNAPFEDAMKIGQAAWNAGAAGYFDGGRS